MILVKYFTCCRCSSLACYQNFLTNFITRSNLADVFGQRIEIDLNLSLFYNQHHRLGLPQSPIIGIRIEDVLLENNVFFLFVSIWSSVNDNCNVLNDNNIYPMTENTSQDVHSNILTWCSNTFAILSNNNLYESTIQTVNQTFKTV